MIQLDPSSPVPLYLQIAEQFRRLIALGALRPGERLPAVRELAVRARVNRNTAARAIQHLEGQGLVRTRVGQGTFVGDGPAQLDLARGEADVDESFDKLLIQAQTLGVPLEGLERRLARRIEQFRRRQAAARSNASGDSAEEGR